MQVKNFIRRTWTEPEENAAVLSLTFRSEYL